MFFYLCSLELCWAADDWTLDHPGRRVAQTKTAGEFVHHGTRLKQKKNNLNKPSLKKTVILGTCYFKISLVSTVPTCWNRRFFVFKPYQNHNVFL